MIPQSSSGFLIRALFLVLFTGIFAMNASLMYSSGSEGMVANVA